MADRIEKIPESLCSNAGLPAGFTNALSFDEQVQWLLNAYNNLLAMIPDNVEFNSVKFIPQALTENEKNIARENIGAGTSNIAQDDVETIVKNNAVSYKNTQILSDGQKELARKNIGAGTSNVEYAVQYVNQNLTEQQKEDARKNIGAASDKLNGAVLTTPQALTENEKFTARNNIGIAYGFSDVPVLYNQVQLYPETYKARARNNIGCPSGIYAANVNKVISTSDWQDVTEYPLYKYYPLLKSPEFIYTYENYLFNIRTQLLYGGTLANDDAQYTTQILQDGNNYLCLRVLAEKVPATQVNFGAVIMTIPVTNYPEEYRENQTNVTFSYNPPYIFGGGKYA